MDKLIKKLKEFNENINGESNINDIQKRFEELAPIFLYGGHIKVRDDYKVFIRTVEFYFHSEKDKGVHDPIVYHRNGRDLEQAPYFPFMSIHAHNSGYDITFEKSGEYRASALIRAYEIMDIHDNKYLKWDTKKCMFVKSDANKYCFNTQSTYLKAVLNGFAFGNTNDIEWAPSPLSVQNSICLPQPRKNVPLYRKEGCNYEKVTKEYYETHKEEFNKLITNPQFFKYGGSDYVQDPKLWQFNREGLTE